MNPVVKGHPLVNGFVQMVPLNKALSKYVLSEADCRDSPQVHKVEHIAERPEVMFSQH